MTSIRRPVLCSGKEKIITKGRLKRELHPKSWTSPPTHKVQFFYEQIYITLQIPSRTPLPAYTQPTAYRRSLRHLPNPPATMDTRLSGRRYRRTRTSPIQNHEPTPQKSLHRRQTRPRKNTGRAYRRVVLYARKGCLPIGNCLRNIPWFKACRERRIVGTMRRWKASLPY